MAHDMETGLIQRFLRYHHQTSVFQEFGAPFGRHYTQDNIVLVTLMYGNHRSIQPANDYLVLGGNEPSL